MENNVDISAPTRTGWWSFKGYRTLPWGKGSDYYHDLVKVVPGASSGTFTVLQAGSAMRLSSEALTGKWTYVMEANIHP